jgi:prepilin signal peptidase PulO-like enzyme (type II secretory pathway)
VRLSIQNSIGIFIAGLLLIPIVIRAPLNVTLISLPLLATLTYLTLFDIKSFRLPNHATYPLIAVGLGWSFMKYGEFLFPDYLIGAFAGYGFIWLLRAYYIKSRGIEAIGLGDAKLLAAVGAWLGWQSIPMVLFVAAFTALTIVIFQTLNGQRFDSKTAIPFGPYLCFGFWTIWSIKYVMI